MNSNTPQGHRKDKVSHVVYYDVCFGADPQYIIATHWPEERKDGDFVKGDPNSLYIMKNHGMLNIRANQLIG